MRKYFLTGHFPRAWACQLIFVSSCFVRDLVFGKLSPHISINNFEVWKPLQLPNINSFTHLLIQYTLLSIYYMFDTIWGIGNRDVNKRAYLLVHISILKALRSPAALGF